MREITYTEAVLEAFREEMRRDPTVFHLCGGLGALASLIPEFGEERVRVCPISEDAYVGASIGAAGIDAVLVGETLMRAANVHELVQDFSSQPKAPRP